jgi:glycine betaine/proline transport system permease protein
MIEDFLPNLSVSDWVSDFFQWLTNTFSFIFDPIETYMGNFMDFFIDVLSVIPPIIFILAIMVLAYFFIKKGIAAPLLSGIGLLFVLDQGLWDNLLNTLTLVVVSGLISIIIGIPVGILMSKSKALESFMKPILDFMQTMPAFVYLIPAVAFFGIGMVPGVFASFIFSAPPTIRLTNLGIRQISKELIEASDSFGTTPMQKLVKVQLPLARASIMAGVNQTIMLALSMVVIGSMIGAPGLGRDVLSALQRADVGNGFVAGFCIVILAIIIDRFTQSRGSKQ